MLVRLLSTTLLVLHVSEYRCLGQRLALLNREKSDSTDEEQFSEAEWKFLSKYPPQYGALKLKGNQTIIVDGKLDEEEWSEVAWSEKMFEDIASSVFPEFANPPDMYQTRVKVRWDSNYLYLGAVVNDPAVWGTITGHNEELTGNKAPWWNNDFEVFIDAYGTTHCYKEFEMNARNATYDVLWRVPDKGMNSIGVPCNDGSVQWCQNSTFNAGQKWTMYGGMKVAVEVPMSISPFSSSSWTVEIAFPLRAKDGHGGLTDSCGYDTNKMQPGDPNLGAKYWWVNFARAQHPLEAFGDHPLGVDFFDPNYQQLCKKVKQQYPTLLGDGPWSCYWEFVWKEMGTTQYMHNPDMWGLLEFVEDAECAKTRATSRGCVCRNLEWPPRNLGWQVYRAQVAYFNANGKYSTTLDDLRTEEYCNPKTNCYLNDFTIASRYPSIFDIRLNVDNSATSCVDYTASSPAGGACFNVTVTFTPPISHYSGDPLGRRSRRREADNSHPTVRVMVREDRFTTATLSGGDIPCL